MPERVVIIGAGHAGLAVSAELDETGPEHRLPERGRIGERWRSQRWDPFGLDRPNAVNR